MSRKKRFAKIGSTGDSAEFEIGYGRPPRSSQFKKGVAANPKGRPKLPPPSTGDILLQVSQELIAITENNQVTHVSKLAALFKRLINMSLSGDEAATRVLFKFRKLFPAKAKQGSPLVLVIGNREMKV